MIGQQAQKKSNLTNKQKKKNLIANLSFLRI